MAYDLTSPAVTQTLIGLAVADNGEVIPLRHGLKPLALTHRQLADYVVSVFQLYGVLFAFDGYLAVTDFVDGYLLAVFVLNDIWNMRWRKCLRFPIRKVYMTTLYGTVFLVSPLTSNGVLRNNHIAIVRHIDRLGNSVVLFPEVRVLVLPSVLAS